MSDWSTEWLRKIYWDFIVNYPDESSVINAYELWITETMTKLLHEYEYSLSKVENDVAILEAELGSDIGTLTPK